jgi:cAMP-binding proteins - catabolite gene activator and regulatory subunit of cAMP-dependent protein kinases
MRIEKSVTSITWIPSEAISGMPKLPFEMGVAHYDDPPPDKLDDLEALRESDAFREANELRAWVEFEDGKPSLYGYSGGGHIGVTRIKLGRRELTFPAVQYPLLQAEPEVGDGWVKFKQSAGGHMGLPAPRRVSGKPFMRIQSASAWTTLELVIRADGSSEGKLIGASPFPRHWVYDADGVLVEKSASVDFERWYRESHGKHTPWGDEDSPAIATAVESELERELSASIMREGAKLERRSLDAGETLITQGEEGQDLFLILDGVVDVEVDGEEVAELGPGTLIGELALLEGGKRTASVYATTPVRAVVVPRDAVSESALEELAASRRPTEA